MSELENKIHMLRENPDEFDYADIKSLINEIGEDKQKLLELWSVIPPTMQDTKFRNVFDELLDYCKDDIEKRISLWIGTSR